MSTSSWFIHHDPSIFPEPDVFKPERWEGEEVKELEKYLVPFSKGVRMCLGFNLGWAELRMVTAYTYRKFDLELADERYVLSPVLDLVTDSLKSTGGSLTMARCLRATFSRTKLDGLDETGQRMNARTQRWIVDCSSKRYVP